MNTCLCKNSLGSHLILDVLAIPLQSMANFLLPTEVTSLKALHRKADKKQRDKIKAILLLDKGYEYGEIAEILLIDYTTVWRWYETYISGGTNELLKDYYVGGMCKLTEVQLDQLVEHLECTMYLSLIHI